MTAPLIAAISGRVIGLDKVRLTRATLLLCIVTAMLAQATWAETQRVEEPARQTTEEVATNR